MTTPATARTLALTALLSTALAAGPASAQEPAAAASADAAVAAPAAPAASTGARASDNSTPWIKRYRPVRNSWELGIYGGVFLPSARHEFYEPDLRVEGFGYQRLGRAGADVGLRVGYYPLSFLGLELEGGVMPMRVADGSSATLYTFRPVAVAQLPYRIAPFVRVGFGLLGISSPTLGRDIDPTLNIGGGVKFYVNRLLALRLDIVDNVATARGVGNARSNNLEVLLGLSLRLGKHKDTAAPLRDSDGDGLYDPGQAGVAAADEDACPHEPGPRENRGCPLRDSDGDGLYDPGQGGVAAADEDACPQEPGPRESQGCPLIDTDKDGLFDPGQPVAAADIDLCPSEPGPRELKGCPDRDQDRIIDKLDKCPDQPEVYNQIADSDGCPDEIPKAVKKISGVLQGIYFDVDKDSIKPRSKPILDKAIKVLKEYSETRWRIEGHTDADGDRDHNMDLSQRRAEAVRTYLIEHGIDAERLVPKGFGPEQPIDTNATAKGKAKNRRIEFKLID
ncbi:OmpA family protein [Nannocystis bainbridge]|uniref:OmpA family protein n=1 Tax=Nannocystis bainbridge TaxID=2995303 RepID=A0ABT5DRK6_9BACT|nr:OmpA family protein [Nannocystis bainbridge]MDC0715689.1 OmpA family protein [Nannocystis bainbridge]